MKNKLQQFEAWFNNKFGWFFCPAGKQGKEERNSIYNKK